MRNVTDEVSNPFGMRPPCEHPCESGGDRRAVFGFGDANADFHVIGDHPGIHGGTDTGVPFTGGAGEWLLDVLEAADLLRRTPTDNGAFPIEARNCFLSYLHACCPPGEGDPDPGSYADLERFFDAELRAIGAHVLLPVGDRAFGHVLREYTARAHRIEADARARHATEIRGRGFLVVPVADPADWGEEEATELKDRFEMVLSRDYRQTADLGRFEPTSDPYFVR